MQIASTFLEIGTAAKTAAVIAASADQANGYGIYINTAGKWVGPVSPWSTFTMSEYIDALVAQGDRESLDYALDISRQNPVWMKKIVAARKKLSPPVVEPPAKEDKN